MARACHLAQLGDVSSVCKGRSHHFSSSHPSPPPPVTRATSSRIKYPGRRGLALGRHSEQPPPTSTATASQEVRSLWLAASSQWGHLTLLLQSQHQARTPVSAKDAAGRAIFKTREQVHCHPQTLQLGGDMEPNEASGHSLSVIEISTKLTERRCCFGGPNPQHAGPGISRAAYVL